MNQENIDSYNPPFKSVIVLEDEDLSGDMGLNDYAINELYADVIFAEFIDTSNTKEENGLIVSRDVTKNSWRKAKVLMVSPLIENKGMTKVGDIVIFPSNKNLKCGRVSYYTKDGEKKTTNNGVFRNEYRIFAKVK